MDKKKATNLSLKLMGVSEAAYLTMIDSNGFPQTRAMLNLRNTKKYPELIDIFQQHKSDFLVYFTTNMSSPKIERIKKNPKVCVYYCKPEEWLGLMIAGTMKIVDDRDIKNELWQNNWTMYYPGGVEDPDYIILQLQPKFIKGYHQLQQYTIDLPEVEENLSKL